MRHALLGLLAAAAMSTAAFAQNAQLDTARAVLQGLATGADAANSYAAAPTSSAEAACGWQVWANPFGAWSSLDRSGLSGGYDVDVYGVNLGLTKYLGERFKAGLSAGYAYGDATLKLPGNIGRVDYDADNLDLALYASYYANNFFADAVLGYQWSWIEDTKWKPIGGKGGDHDAHTWFTHLKAGYNFGFCDWTLTPSVAWDYVRTDMDGFDWQIPGMGALPMSSIQEYSSRMPVMLRAARQFAAGELYARGGYIREFRGYSFLRGEGVPQNFGTVGAGWMGAWKRFDYGAAYDYTWASQYDDHQVNLYFGLKF